MKFATMRVRVPVDDALPAAAVYDHLRKLLEDRGTEGLKLPVPATNGAEPELPATLPEVGRIHWPAVEVVQAVERTPPRPATRTRGEARP